MCKGRGALADEKDCLPDDDLVACPHDEREILPPLITSLAYCIDKDLNKPIDILTWISIGDNKPTDVEPCMKVSKSHLAVIFGLSVGPMRG